MTDQAFDQTQRSKLKDIAFAGVVALLLAILYMALMSATELWDRDEPLYARTAVEMLLSGDWVIPTYNGHLFAHKPPMTYWFMATSFWLFGENEFAARFISAPSMAGTAFLTYLIARHMFDHVVGIWAMIMFGTAIMSVYLGSIAQHDALMMLFIVLALYAYVRYLYKPGQLILMLLLFTFAMTATLYIKGPVGPAVVCTTLFFSWLFTPLDMRPKFPIMVAFVLAFLVSCALFALWLIPANSATQGELVQMGVGKHIIQRFQAPLENYGGTAALGYWWMLPAYIPVLIIMFMPWTIHLPAGFKALISGTLATRREHALLWGWMAPTFIMFTLAGSKLPHYIFPMFPAVGILAAAVMIKQTRATGALPLSRFGAWFYLNLSPGLAIVLLVVPLIRPDIIPFWLGIPAALILFAIAFFTFKRQKNDDAIGASKILAMSTPFVFLFCYWAIVPRAEPLIKISKDIGAIINQAKVSKDHIYMQGFLEPSMVFYISAPLDKPLSSLPASDNDVRALLASNDELVLIAKSDRFDEIQNLAGDRPFEVLGTVSAINTNANLEDQDVVVAVRR